MSKPPKHHQINSRQLETDGIRVVQQNAAQDLMFSMRELGEPCVTFQLEIEGVVECLVARRCTQLELPSVIAAVAAAQPAEPARAAHGA